MQALIGVLDHVARPALRGVRGLGMEACVTLGMLTPSQAGRFAEAGLTSYNHNLDTGPDFYDSIIATRT